MRKIFLSFVLIAAGNFAAFGQNNPKPTLQPLDERTKAIFARRIQKWQKQIDSCSPPSCDDSDRVVLLTRILINDRLLGRGSDAAATMAQIRVILKKNPKLIHYGQLPNQTHAELAEQEAEKQKREELAKKSFVPKDSSCLGIMGEDRDAVFLYQYHLEFYHLPKDMPPLGNSRNTPQAPYGICDQILPKYAWKPFKTMTFKHRISDVSGYERIKDVKIIWICPDELEGDYYSGSTDEERAIIQAKYHDKPMPWVNSSAEYGYFCGAISLDGKIVYQLPIRQHSPDTLFQFGDMGKEGKSLEIKVGKLMTGDGEDGPESFVGDFWETLIWTYPDHLQTFEKKDAAGLSEALKKAGLTGM